MLFKNRVFQFLIRFPGQFPDRMEAIFGSAYDETMTIDCYTSQQLHFFKKMISYSVTF